MRNGDYHPAFEEYCEAIFELVEDDLEVIQARIAARLDVSRPAVSEMIKRMSAEGLVNSDDGISLTDDGMVLAQQVVRRHRIAERFLTDVLGLSWSQAHHEAGKWEHVISDDVEIAMVRFLDNPETCPHGNPIPGSDYVEPDLVTLAEHRVGSGFVIRRIPEELEFAPGMLEFLESAQLLPGRHGVVTGVDDDGGRTLDLDGASVHIDAFVSDRILVAANDSAPPAA